MALPNLENAHEVFFFKQKTAYDDSSSSSPSRFEQAVPVFDVEDGGGHVILLGCFSSLQAGHPTASRNDGLKPMLEADDDVGISHRSSTHPA